MNSLLSVPIKKMERKLSDEITDNVSISGNKLENNSAMSSRSSAFVERRAIFLYKVQCRVLLFASEMEPLYTLLRFLKIKKKATVTQNCEVTREM